MQSVVIFEDSLCVKSQGNESEGMDWKCHACIAL